MLRIYQSNQLDMLEQLIEYLIERQPLSDPFTPEIILVQSSGMAQWLQMALAEKFGIAANIQFPLPARFLWQMFTCVLPDVPQQNAFDRPSLCWRLMATLPQMADHPAFAPLRHYLQDDQHSRKTFQLCWKIADLFEQYLIYRPDWLALWEAGKPIPGCSDDQHWQAALWRALTSQIAQTGLAVCHRANLLSRFIQRLAQPTPPAGLPARLFLCGISALPPAYLQALQALGRHCDIHLMVTNPCRYYWGDIRNAADLARRARRHPHPPSAHSPDLTPDIGNPLLASWGKQGRDHISLLAQLPHCEEIDAFTDIPDDSLLHRLQADLLELRDPTCPPEGDNADTSQHKRPLAPDDHSISLHLCHSPQREMEVLHDQLLAMLDNDPQLTPRDIIVMVPDIDSYYPFIQAVFGAATGSRQLPYAISDRRSRQTHPILQAATTLLSLPESRFSSEDILALLEVPALAARFNIDENGLNHLRQWISDAGIRWGLDDDNVRELNLPVTGQHTWRFGLNRMLLGYAMDSHAGQWCDILPYDPSSGLIASLAGHLADLIAQLEKWRDTLATPRHAAQWLPLYPELLRDFFLPDTQTSPLITLLEQHWQTLLAPILDSGYPDPIPIALLRDQLDQTLEQQRFSQHFLAGAVNFCTLMPMRSIPFKIICLAGMNEGVYPRTQQPPGFDLISQQPRPGDRARRDDDRYLLLEALISARQTLYISYIGRTITDNRPCFPSILIEELIDYISQSHCLAGDQPLPPDTSAARTRQHLTCLHPRTPFDPDNFRPGQRQQSYAAQWLPAASDQGQPHPPFIQPLPPAPCTEIDIDRLQRFWQHPVRGFFQQRLNISYQQDTPELDTYEPFTLDPLQRYQIRQTLLNALIEGQPPEKIHQHYRAAGKLPQGAFGDQLWQTQLADIQPLAAQIRPWYAPGQPLEIDLQLASTRLTGWISQTQPDSLTRWQPTSLDARHAIALWLEHLLCCAIGHPLHSRIFGTHNSHWHFPPFPPDEALAHLTPFIRGYQQGLNAPILLLPKSASAWLNACYDPQTQQINWQDDKQATARRALHQAWHGGYPQPGEGQDLYYQRLHRTLTEEYCQTIIDQAQTWLLPLWQNHHPIAQPQQSALTPQPITPKGTRP